MKKKTQAASQQCSQLDKAWVKCWPTVVLALILCLQCGMAIHFGQQKSGYHIDEIFTFELANYPDGFTSRTDGVINNWTNGEFYKEALITTGSERFNYAIPYHNQETDVHPPLYYFVIHTLSSIAGTFSKWIGIIPNILFLLFSSILLYKIAGEMLPSKALALITVAFWGLGIGAMNSAVFIRMYAMLTTACLLLVWLHLRAWDSLVNQQISWKSMLGLVLATAFGILTQYYFLIFCLFWCGCWFFVLLVTKRWKAMVVYAIAEFAAVAASIAFFPKMVYHLFSSGRGKEAFANASNGNVYSEHLKKVLSINSKELINGWGKEIIFLLLVIVLVYALYRYLRKCSVKISERGELVMHLPALTTAPKVESVYITKEKTALMAAAVTTVGYTLLVARIAPYQTDRYYMCIHPLAALLVIVAIYHVVKLLIRKQTVAYIAMLIFTVAMLGLSHRDQNVNYLYSGRKDYVAAMSAYEGYPVVVTNEATYDGALDWCFPEFATFDKVYRCGRGDFSSLSNLEGDVALKEGFLLFAGSAKGTEEEYFSKICEYLPVASYELIIKEGGTPIYYCELERDE